ncbi:MAG: ATP-dependent RecD-like DNA helicase [Bacteroidota bacterium]|nr:ATP-dependent RecD-like DNA helicase [Bacteroidota bacterium]MDP4195795.1 ATP-dependent RecD-like DNA helicase [Bacteroidota bacterium]
MTTTIQGVIERFTYHNEETGYSVARLENNITAIGNLPGIKVGQTVKLNGNWVFHPSYGKQFKIESFSASYPATVSGIAKYLGSGLVKGIGPVTAERIVKVFKEQTLDIIENSIERLIEIEGVGNKRLEMIKKGWKEQKSIKDLMLFLQSHDISTTLAIKIYKTYGERASLVVKEDPYQMTYDIWGIGFKTADKIGKNLGFEELHPARIKAGIIYVLNEAVNDGHVYLPLEKLTESCSEILNMEISTESPVLSEMQMQERIIIKDDNVYLPPFYYAEKGINSRVKALLNEENSESSKEGELFSIENHFFSDEQLKAVRDSQLHRMLILTGGPGTGKTTTLKGIIKAHQLKNKKIMLAAPTGRAAKRMSEVIGMEAKTIHRLLEFDPAFHRFKRDEENQLETDLLVIDEVSMIDTILMNSLLKAVKNSSTLILVGDVNQLPSIGAGNVLKDMIDSGKIPVVRLTKIFRQAEKSKIIVNSHRINRGEYPEITNKEGSDFFFLEESDNEKIPGKILSLCKNRLPKKFGFDPIKDIQVLTPMYRGVMGANNLNAAFQEDLNNNRFSFAKGGRQFKIGDKVMQLRNNYDKEVFNGDLGFIRAVDLENQVMKIDFGTGTLKDYDFEDLDELVLAYAVTVHKSQGSEYPCVILPLTLNHYMMLQRNLLYTAITRAKKLLIIIGTKKALAIALRNNKVQERYTSLFRYETD